VSAIDIGVDRILEFGLERYWINRVPWALLGCAAGLFMIAMDPGPPGLLPFVVIGALAVIGAAYAFSVLAFDHAIDRLKSAWAVGLVLVAVLGVALFLGLQPRYRRSSIDDPVFRTLGWIFVIFSLGFIGFALKKYLRPNPPLLTLSPAGLHSNISWLKDLTIPWYEVEHVGQLEHHHPGGIVARHPEMLAIAFSQDYYDREILPRRTFLSGRMWTAMFQPRGARMQMLLPYPWFSISMQEMQQPVEARWKAFRELDAGTPPPAAASTPVRITAWSPALLTRWRITWLAVPTAGIMLMLAHFAGAWDSAFLKTAREDFGEKRAWQEKVRDARSRGEFIIKSGR
jgi:hypothetical protein